MSSLHNSRMSLAGRLRRSLLPRAAAMMIGAAAFGAAATGAQSDAAAAPTLLVGVDYVVPAFVPGAKVRTPEMPDAAMAEAVAQKLGERVDIVPATKLSDGSDSAPRPGNRNARAIALRSLPANAYTPPDMIRIPTGYAARAMVIMRTDTDIKSWAQLKGRTVCVSEGGRYVGKMADLHGAIEQVYKAPADALLALRIGQCDAALHDDTMLNALIELPEWKKFSASLPPSTLPGTSLDFIVRSDDADTITALRQLTDEWKSKRYLAKLNVQRVRDIAFEVYLDQTVSDCH
ncbi:MAG TPA: transporter substrate-binding domain-containing protein [Candidimonas sp.]|nr:transporter substrate-binding domain-containing protein [Candidimonas sp.]